MLPPLVCARCPRTSKRPLKSWVDNRFCAEQSRATSPGPSVGGNPDQLCSPANREVVPVLVVAEARRGCVQCCKADQRSSESLRRKGNRQPSQIAGPGFPECQRCSQRRWHRSPPALAGKCSPGREAGFRASSTPSQQVPRWREQRALRPPNEPDPCGVWPLGNRPLPEGLLMIVPMDNCRHALASCKAALRRSLAPAEMSPCSSKLA